MEWYNAVKNAIYGSAWDVHRTATERYLTGPYPLHLRRQTGNLANNIFVKLEARPDSIIATLGVGTKAWYGRIWEGVGEYSHRRGRYFRNATPMWRPFLSPALKDNKRNILRRIWQALRVR